MMIFTNVIIRCINSLRQPSVSNTPKRERDIHAHDGIRTHNLGKRAAVDPRLRPRGHRDWQFTLIPIDKTTIHKLRVLKASLETNTFTVPSHLHSFMSSFHESSHTFSFNFPIVWSSTDDSRNLRTSSYVPSGHRREA